MKHHTPSFIRRNVNPYVAAVLSYLLLLGQMTPLALAAGPPAPRPAAAPHADVARESAGVTPRTELAAAPAPLAAPAAFAPTLTATKTDSYTNSPNPAPPGTVITYTITINNSGPDAATNLTLNDNVDPNTTITGTPVASPIAIDETYNVIGNVRIQPNAAQGLLANDNNPNTGNSSGLSTTAETKSSANCTGGCSNNVTISTDGSFSYNPPAGFNGTDTFTYTVTSANGSDTATATLAVGDGAGGTTGVIWFIDDSAAPGGDGRLTNPFNCFVGAGCFSASTLDEAGDAIFLFDGAYTGGHTLLNNQELVGQDASASLATIAGVTVQPYSDALPATDSTAGGVTITTTNVTAITLGQGNTLRGFTIGNVGTGTKILGSSFGTLSAGNAATPDMVLSGTGKALDLTTGAIAATFASVATTSSGDQGIELAGVTGAVAFGSTTVSGSTTQGILVGTTTADINFGNTSVTGGTDAISLQNNASGTRTFGAITTSGNSGVGFLHGAGGGTVSVTGATSITNPGGNGIDIDSSNANLTFAATTVNKGATGNIGVDLTSNASRVITFSSLAVTTTTGFALNTNNSGTVNVSNAAGSSLTQSGAGGGAASLTGTALGLNFTTVSSDGGGNGIIFSGGSGTFASGTTNLQNNAGIGLMMSSSGVAANFGNTTVNSSSGDAVDLSGQTANVTFGALNLSPDATLRGLDVATTTGTVTSTSGTITTTDGVAVNVVGPTALSLVLTAVNADNTGTANSCVSLTNVSGTVNMQGGTLVGGTASAFAVSAGSANITYAGTVTQNSAARVVDIQGTTGGTVSFTNTGAAVTGGASSTGVHIGDTTAVNGNVSFAELNLGTAAARMTNQAVTITNGGTGATYSLGALSIFTNNAQGIGATNFDGTLNSTSGTVDSNGDEAINIDGPVGLTNLGMTLTRVDSSGGTANGITIQDTSGSFTVNGDGTNTADGGNGSGGTIANKSGADANDLQGIGIFLNNVTNITLRRIVINGTNQNYAIRGNSLSNFLMEFSNIGSTGLNGTSAGNDEGSVRFTQITGTNTIKSSFLHGGREDTVRVVNTSGTLTGFTIDDCDVTQTDVPEGGDAIKYEGQGTAVMTMAVTNSRITAAKDNPFNSSNSFGTTMTLLFKGNTVSNNHSAIVAAGGGVAITPSGVLRLDFDGNTLRDAVGTALLVNASGNASPGTSEADIEGYIRNNVIGVAGSANSGSDSASGIQVESNGGGDHDALVISNNQVFQYNNHAIFLSFVDDQGKTANINVTVDGNTTNTPGTINTDFNGFHLNAGATSGPPAPGDDFTLCLDTKNNNFTGGGKGVTPPNNGDVRLRQRIITTVRLPGYTGANNDNTAVINYLRPPATGIKNNQFGAGNASNTVSTGGGGFVNTPGGAPCAQPSFPNLAPVTSKFTPPDGPPGSDPVIGGVVVAPSSDNTNVTSRPFVSPMRLVKTQAAQPFVQQRATSTAKAGLVQKKTPAKGDAPQGGSTQSTAPITKTGTKSKPAGGTKNDGPTINPPVVMGDNLTWNIGTLPAGSSVTITFQVTVDNPFTGGSPQVSNQGTVTADGGVSVLTDDPDVAGANNPTVTPILATNIFARDGKEPEPPTGESTLLFTVALSAPALGAVTVNYSTADGGATPATGGASCAGNVDYVSVTGGSVMFAAGEQLRTVPVTICSDGPAEPDETFLLNLTGATGGSILDNQATGTITANVPGTFIISELRTFGPGGSNDPADEFIEFYNNTESPLTVADTNSGAGYGVYTVSSCNGVPTLLGTIPNGTVIPARGHYLMTGTAYSLANYGGAGAATGNLTLAGGGIPSNANVAVFSTSDITQLSTTTRLDAVGFGANTGGAVCDLMREGATAPPVANNLTMLGQYSVVRDPCGKGGDPDMFGPCTVVGAKDTHSNAGDFFMVDPNGTNADGTQRIGAAGPENLASPRRNTIIGIAPFDSSVLGFDPPNRVRDLMSDPGNNSTHGTLSFRRRYVNHTGSPVTRLRFRIVDISTFSADSGNADLRARTAPASISVMVNDPATCALEPGSPTAPCMATLIGTTLEEPPTQPNGGGFNSTLSAGTITTGAPLAPGASINLQLLFGIQATGNFKFLFIIEALP